LTKCSWGTSSRGASNTSCLTGKGNMF
jgi:hypothetical protein